MKRTTSIKILVIACVLILSVGLSAAAKKSAIPKHPSKLKFGPLDFQVPNAAEYKHQLAAGNTVYVAEDHSLPLVNISVTIRSGAFLDPEGKVGLAGATGAMMRRGGTAEMTAEEFDERADFLAAELSSYIGDTSGGANLNCITRVIDDCLGLFFEMMKQPRFQEDRLAIEKENFLEGMKQRNDDARSISGREWAWLMSGMEHFSSRQMTAADLDAITRDDLIDFHGKYWRPELLSFAVSGDVDTEQVLAKLNAALEGWKVEGPDVPWPPPAPDFTPQAGLYHAEKDIPQGRVTFGHATVQRDSWDNPEYFALSVMNDILGGGGFTSRILKKVRSDEGLAYSAGSMARVGTYWPGTFQVYYQSKSPTVALAAQIAIAEIKGIQTELVSDEELQTAKNSFIDTFPSRFESPAQVASIFLGDDYMGRPHSYWSDYRKNVGNVDAEAVRKAAQKYLDPDNLIFLIVGKWEEIEAGDADGRASMKEFHGGKVTHLPERDPLTLKPVNK